MDVDQAEVSSRRCRKDAHAIKALINHHARVLDLVLKKKSFLLNPAILFQNSLDLAWNLENYRQQISGCQPNAKKEKI